MRLNDFTEASLNLSTNTAAQLDLHTHESDAAEVPGHAPSLPVTTAPPFALNSIALKQQAAERVAAHRARRQGNTPRPAAPALVSTPARARAAQIAAAVAERYAQSQSYRAFLASEAERAIRDAENAELAAFNAQAVAHAQTQLLFELEQRNAPHVAPAFELTPPTQAHAIHHAAPPTPAPAPAQPLTQPLTQPLAQPLTVRHMDQVATPARPLITSSSCPLPEPLNEEDALALDEEIAFRQSPTFEDPATAPIDLPANLIEFPRQLIAARRARPRIAEGPLREDADAAPNSSQLRIFEVEPAQISSAPSTETVTPVWASILLDAQPVTHLDAHAAELAAAQLEAHYAPIPVALPRTQVAPVELRLMASAVDGAIILASFIALTGIASATANFASTRLTPGTLGTSEPVAISLPITAIAVTATLALFWTIYHLLFFTFSEATPGMNYARISLCTFTDENPTRKAMRRRILGTLLAAAPLGLGFLWAWLDDERLGWHDRLSRMYQRAY